MTRADSSDSGIGGAWSPAAVARLGTPCGHSSTRLGPLFQELDQRAQLRSDPGIVQQHPNVLFPTNDREIVLESVGLRVAAGGAGKCLEIEVAHDLTELPRLVLREAAGIQ
ncbi:MAG TPA: hypothetical protein VIY28_06530 [Pseudonocardiaceae bacterium]